MSNELLSDYNSASNEMCCKCHGQTGKAGGGDGSLYAGDYGPYCESCWSDVPDELATKNELLVYELKEKQKYILRLERSLDGACDKVREKELEIANMHEQIELSTKEITGIAVYLKQHLYPDNHGWEALPYLRGVISQVDNMSTAIPELTALREAQRWIPCSERMPPKHTDSVLLWRGVGFVGRWRFGHLGEPSQDTEAWRSTCSGRLTHQIDYWMPLPAPPETES